MSSRMLDAAIYLCSSTLVFILSVHFINICVMLSFAFTID